MSVEQSPRTFTSRTWPWMILLIILAVVPFIVVATRQVNDPARRKRMIGEISNFIMTLETFERENGRYPTTTEGLAALMTRPESVPAVNWRKLLDGVPNDKWGHPYLYQGPNILGEGKFNIISAGEDGKLGTPDDIDRNTCY